MLNEIKHDVQDSGRLWELRLFPQAAYATSLVQAVQGPAILLHKVAQKYSQAVMSSIKCCVGVSVPVSI